MVLQEYHIVIYLTLSSSVLVYRIKLYSILFFHILSYSIFFYHIMSYPFFPPLSCHIISYLSISSDERIHKVSTFSNEKTRLLELYNFCIFILQCRTNVYISIHITATELLVSNSQI